MKKIGILVDGQAEYHGLKTLLPKVETNVQILSPPLRCDLQPFATAAQNAYVAAKVASILIAKGASDIVVLIDKETRPECTPGIVSDIERQLKKRLAEYEVIIQVVLKVRTFENWLVADPGAFLPLRGLFRNTKRISKAVVPDKADHIKAIELLTSCARSGSFDKVSGAKAICDSINPNRAAENSRSFRRFLRTLGHPAYVTQSRHPAR